MSSWLVQFHFCTGKLGQICKTFKSLYKLHSFLCNRTECVMAANIHTVAFSILLHNDSGFKKEEDTRWLVSTFAQTFF